uniref:(northern house mosquito) hypothetical protein n=1 Tax=Culex pipiens TaxID=7175 RepID=A0A8D8BQ35_CULPI
MPFDYSTYLFVAYLALCGCRCVIFLSNSEKKVLKCDFFFKREVSLAAKITYSISDLFFFKSFLPISLAFKNLVNNDLISSFQFNNFIVFFSITFIYSRDRQNK